MDRNRNGEIDDGRELFGRHTEQPESTPGEGAHGFRALAVFDDAAHGGNGDGFLDSSDAIFEQLRIWRDLDHDRRSSPSELSALDALGISRLNLDCRESRRRDEHGTFSGIEPGCPNNRTGSWTLALRRLSSAGSIGSLTPWTSHEFPDSMAFEIGAEYRHGIDLLPRSHVLSTGDPFLRIVA